LLFAELRIWRRVTGRFRPELDGDFGEGSRFPDTPPAPSGSFLSDSLLESDDEELELPLEVAEREELVAA
jgi:hypothetical protein